MDPTIIVALIGAGATVVAAFIARVSGKSAGRKERQQEIDDAPRRYVDHLDRLIRAAVQEGDRKAVVNARAIVATRNDLRSSMVRIADQLNSEIDRLAEEIGGPANGRRGSEPVAPRLEPLFETLQVLEKKWPAKKDQVEVELRKVLAELGILGDAPARARDEDEDEDEGTSRRTTVTA